MASSRVERLAQRMRGNQHREVREVDFGLSFPVAPAEAAVTALPESDPLPSSRESIKATHKESTGPISIRNGTIEANTSAKRRKSGAERTSAGTSARGAPVPDIYTLTDDSLDNVPAPNAAWETSEDAIMHPARDIAQIGKSSEPAPRPRLASLVRVTPPPREELAEEVTESPLNQPGSGSRARFLRSSLDKGFVGINNYSTIDDSNQSPKPRRKSSRLEVAASPVTKNRTISSQEVTVDPKEDLHGTTFPPRRRARKRKAPYQDKPAPVVQDAAPTESGEMDAMAQAIDDEESASVMGRHRGRRSLRNSQVASVPELGESSAATSRPPKRQKIDARPKPSKPRQPKNSKAAKSNMKQASDKRTAKKLQSGLPIPILVQRLTKRPQYESDAPDADILNMDIQHARRPGVNSIDVLTGICDEIIDTAFDHLEEVRVNSEDSVFRRECKTKINALNAFQLELKSRLSAHTIHLDALYSFNKRVPQEHKNKIDLRKEVSSIRAQREQVALQMDQIRINHENDSKVAQDRDAMNTAAHAIELAIDRGKTNAPQKLSNLASEMTGIEFLLKRVGSKFSKSGDSGGILHQIKNFNGFLERAAVALEGNNG